MPNSLTREVPFTLNVKDITIDEINVLNPTERTLYFAVYDENRRGKLRAAVQPNNSLRISCRDIQHSTGLFWVLHDGSELRFTQEYENGREGGYQGATTLQVTVIYTPKGLEKVEMPPDAPDDIPERIKALVDITFDGLPVPKHPKVVGEVVADIARHAETIRSRTRVLGGSVVPQYELADGVYEEIDDVEQGES